MVFQNQLIVNIGLEFVNLNLKYHRISSLNEPQNTCKTLFKKVKNNNFNRLIFQNGGFRFIFQGFFYTTPAQYCLLKNVLQASHSIVRATSPQCCLHKKEIKCIVRLQPRLRTVPKIIFFYFLSRLELRFSFINYFKDTHPII